MIIILIHLLQSYFMWDSFMSGVAVSTMRTSHNQNGENEFGEMEYMNITVVTSNEPYGINDCSNPLFDGRKVPKFNLKKGGVLFTSPTQRFACFLQSNWLWHRENHFQLHLFLNFQTSSSPLVFMRVRLIRLYLFLKQKQLYCIHSLIRWWYLNNGFKFRCNPYCNSIFTEQISCHGFWVL